MEDNKIESLFDLYIKKDKDKADTSFINFIQNDFTRKDFEYLKAQEYNNKLVIEFKPTDNCNFNCSYCCFHNKKSKGMSELTFKNFINFLEYNIENNIFPQEEFFIFIYGGEPTMHPNLTKFIIELNEFKRTHNKKINFLIQSNGSMWSLTKFKKEINILKNANVNFKFSFSYHPEEVKLNDLIPKIKYLISEDAFDVLTYMLTISNIKKDIHMINFFESANVPIYVRTILQESELFNSDGKFKKYKKYISTDKDDDSYILTTKDANNKIINTKMSFEDLSTQGYLNFNGYNCSAGINSFLISPEGEIYRCDMDYLYKKNRLHDVNSVQEYKPSKCLKCTHTFCSIYFSDKWK